MRDFYAYLGLNRTLCDVLEEMRKLNKSRNYGYLESLIEEAQSMGNRMEAGLGDMTDFKDIRQTSKEIQKEVKEKKEELKELNKKINKLKESLDE